MQPESVPVLEPSLESQFEAAVIEIVDPSRLPGSRFMEELIVKMSSLVRVQLAANVPTMTSEMQVLKDTRAA